MHIDNLDIALEMIAHVGMVYNELERRDQKELLRHVVSRVVIDNEGIICLELRPPFSYLQNIYDGLREEVGVLQDKLDNGEKKTDGAISIGSPKIECSLTIQCGWRDKTQSEPVFPENPTDRLHQIAFPQYVNFSRFSTIDMNLAVR